MIFWQGGWPVFSECREKSAICFARVAFGMRIFGIAAFTAFHPEIIAPQLADAVDWHSIMAIGGKMDP
ncbi:MAG TPA: hypothetical protein VHS96_00705 [Bacteroidia bacterium]|nr:hypothetical protein [Bacteroidia bacterium]